MMHALSGKRIAILAMDGVEQVELTVPRQALIDAGAQVDVVSPKQGEIQGWNHYERGDKIHVDRPLDRANAGDYDALQLPGGVQNPDYLRMIPAAVSFVKDFIDAGKPVASICHGPWMLIEADAVRHKTVTSWPSLKTDLRNAGATWKDQEVVRDGRIVTSRMPADIPAFNDQMIDLFASVKSMSESSTR
jgi:protease I